SATATLPRSTSERFMTADIEAKPALSLVNAAVDPEDGTGLVLAVIGKRTYAIEGGECQWAKEQLALGTEPTHDPVVRDADTLMTGGGVEVVVSGVAYAHERTSRFEARVRTGSLMRGIQVSGDRRCELDAAGKVRFSSAELVEKVALTWENAYGGYDDASAA